MTSDDKVQESQGVLSTVSEPLQWVEALHLKNGIGLRVGTIVGAVMKPDEARRLARALYRQARRWEARHPS